MKRLITLCLICFSLVVDASVKFNHIVVFGDSLSDNGNSYERTQHFVPQTPPYYAGRFSDGPVWIEYLSKKLSSKDSFLQDYALGGAGVTAEDEDIEGLFTLANQVKDFLQNNNQIADKDDLFIIWIGANNYLILPDDEDDTIKSVQTGINKALDKLLNAGAKNFLVFNLPDLSKTPFAKSVSEEDLSKLERYTHNHNDMIQKMIEGYKKSHPEANWYFYDIHAMMKKVLEKPQEYGFTNIDGTCFEEDLSLTVRLHPVIRVEKLYNIAPQSHCDNYLFFDPVHPTGKAHELMAKEVMGDLAEIFKASDKS